MDKKSEDIVKESKDREHILFPPYDPIAGLNTVTAHIDIAVDDRNMMKFPASGIEEDVISEIILYGSVEKFQREMNNISMEELLLVITQLRVKHDFEFWAATCVKIWDKINEGEVPFILRPAQRKLLKALEVMRLAGEPIRCILLKARQWGGSTLVQLYMGWIQLFHRRNWHSAICAHVKDAAKHIRGMFTRMAESHPKYIQPITFKPYEGSQSIKMITERGCIVGVASSETPEALRTYNFQMTHLSEVAFFKSTEKRTAEDLIQTIRASVPNEPYTIAVLESTAKGVGSFFHSEWLKAIENKQQLGYTPVFVAWWEIEIYRKEIIDFDEFISSFTDYDWVLWNLGATLEGINWYKSFKEQEGYSDWRMMSEFPSNADEAFQSTGHRAFNRVDVLRVRKDCKEPLLIGEIYGKEYKGFDALTDVRIDKIEGGNLSVWELPDGTQKIKYRYVLFADIGGRSDLADYSTVKVMDREPLMYGGKPRVVAVWHGHIDQDLFAWKAAQLATIYQNGLLAIEVNSLSTKGTEGDHHLTVLDEIAPYYENLYTRTSPERVREGVPAIYGFHTNKSTKPMIINELNASLRDYTYVERDNNACNEMDMYEIKADGSYGAVKGAKDDRVITTAGVLWLSNKHMDFPVEVNKEKKVHNIIVNEATM